MLIAGLQTDEFLYQDLNDFMTYWDYMIIIASCLIGNIVGHYWSVGSKDKKPIPEILPKTIPIDYEKINVTVLIIVYFSKKH